MNVQIYTIKQARSIIRHASGTEKVAPFLGHRDKNVRASAAFALTHKFGASEERTKSGPAIEARTIPEEERHLPFTQEDTVEAGRSALIDPEIEALASKYEVTTEFVLTLLKEKGDLGAVKRSLTSRKSALTRAAKTKAA